MIVLPTKLVGKYQERSPHHENYHCFRHDADVHVSLPHVQALCCLCSDCLSVPRVKPLLRHGREYIRFRPGDTFGVSRSILYPGAAGNHLFNERE